jgi:hypothetical protein
MSIDTPVDDETPWRFANSPRLKSWFLRGFQDALHGEPLPESGITRYCGFSACEAYRVGFQTGQAQGAARRHYTDDGRAVS